MEKIDFPRKLKVYLPLIGLFLVLVFMMPQSPKFNYDFRKGSPWMHETLIAQFDFPVLKTEAQLLEERDKAGADVISYYRSDSRVSSRSLSGVSALDLGGLNDLRPQIADAVAFIY